MDEIPEVMLWVAAGALFGIAALLVFAMRQAQRDLRDQQERLDRWWREEF